LKKESLERVAAEFRGQKIITPNFYGKLTLSLEEGKIVLVRQERTIKPE
jgi:hypothetical protein